jgi:predicted GNAT superfamily acetyltransferase
MSSTTALSQSSSDGHPARGLVVDIRLLDTLKDYQACVELQREVWGAEFDEIVPASLIRACTHVGALTIGAFNAEEELVGFVFGLTGVKQGEVVHWSHMLGVRSSLRDHGVGQRLKESQRAELGRRGIKRMYWTFDPLQARNAHLNINRLGARVVEYVVDMYGTSQSPLHSAVGTDRLVVVCATNGEASSVCCPAAETNGYPVFSPFPQESDYLPTGDTAARALIEVPRDLQDVIAHSPATAREWRTATRSYFQWAFSHGYNVTGVQRDTAQGRVFFVIERE